ncbi:transmembrane protein 223 [Tribolium madens]|uniref:transmembrane protein 223 n=1 Tax=Tribolium madens TaxID=41895 RepID=UPI001CF72819|nr:transmembrane protein 223 [Tribolium madens]XP_044252625.1 transmembrane protein 223 [Tribolium madens]
MIGMLRIQHFVKNVLKRPSFVIFPRVRYFSEKPLDVNTNVAKDVILFKYDNPRFFKIINIFAGCQFVFWSYLSVFAYSKLRDAPVDPSKETTWWRKINLGENKYRNGLAVISFIIGYGILTITWMYTLRSVRYLILHQGGQNLSFVTYTPFMKNRIFTVSLKNVNCKESRSVAVSQLPLKVKGHYLHYILDMRGEFKNPTLFDHTAGLRRKWRTAA